MHTRIEGFFGEYRFLSNFWYASVTLDGVVYPTVEHAYQAAKTLDHNMRRMIANARTPGDAKRAGRLIKLRADWTTTTRLSVMRSLVTQKFSHPHLAEKLLATGDAYLEETNSWGDTFWGVSGGVGTNHLGHILMDTRSALRCLEM